jgi:hypothetical protein
MGMTFAADAAKKKEQEEVERIKAPSWRSWRMSPLERTPSYTAPGRQLTSTQPLAEPKLIQLADDAAHCQRCPLDRNATQTVFGEGPIDAALSLVTITSRSLCRIWKAVS